MNEKTPPQNNETLIAEIREEIGRERLENFFKKFKGLIIGLIAFIIIGFSSYEIYKYYSEKSRQDSGDALLAVVSDLNSESNIAKLEAIDANNGAGQLAQITQAKIYAGKGDVDKAISTYENIYNNARNEPAIIDLAKINSINLLMNIDENHPKLNGIFSKENFSGPFKFSLQELAAIHAVNNDNKEKAIELLQQLTSDAQTPTSINLRAQNLLTGLGVKNKVIIEIEEEVNEES